MNDLVVALGQARQGLADAYAVIARDGAGALPGAGLGVVASVQEVLNTGQAALVDGGVRGRVGGAS